MDREDIDDGHREANFHPIYKALTDIRASGLITIRYSFPMTGTQGYLQKKLGLTGVTIIHHKSKEQTTAHFPIKFRYFVSEFKNKTICLI